MKKNQFFIAKFPTGEEAPSIVLEVIHPLDDGCVVDVEKYLCYTPDRIFTYTIYGEDCIDKDVLLHSVSIPEYDRFLEYYEDFQEELAENDNDVSSIIIAHFK